MIRAVISSMIMSSNSNQNGIIKTVVVVDSFVVFRSYLTHSTNSIYEETFPRKL